MVIYTGSPAGELRITAELWVNEAFVPAVSCHDAFGQSGIVFMRAPCVRTQHHTLWAPVCTHVGDRDRKLHQSLSHAEGGSLKEGVSFLSLTVALLLSLSSVSLSVSPQHTHLSLCLSLSFYLLLAIPVLPDLPWVVFLPSTGRQGEGWSGCYQGQPDGRVYPGIGDSFWGKTQWPYW